MILIEDRFGVVNRVKDCLKIVAPFVHFSVDLRRCIGVCLPMIDRFVAQLDYQTLDLGVSHEKLQEYQAVIRGFWKVSIGSRDGQEHSLLIMTPGLEVCLSPSK